MNVTCTPDVVEAGCQLHVQLPLPRHVSASMRKHSVIMGVRRGSGDRVFCSKHRFRGTDTVAGASRRDRCCDTLDMSGAQDFKDCRKDAVASKYGTKGQRRGNVNIGDTPTAYYFCQDSKKPADPAAPQHTLPPSLA